MQKRRNLLGKFYRLLANPSDHIAMLEQSLQDTRDMLHNRIKEYAALKNEIIYLYEIFQRRNGCWINIQLDDNRGLILYTTTSDGIVNNTIVYVPRECLQIAEINTTVDGKVIQPGADPEAANPFKPSNPYNNGTHI